MLIRHKLGLGKGMFYSVKPWRLIMMYNWIKVKGFKVMPQSFLNGRPVFCLNFCLLRWDRKKEKYSSLQLIAVVFRTVMIGNWVFSDRTWIRDALVLFVNCKKSAKNFVKCDFCDTKTIWPRANYFSFGTIDWIDECDRVINQDSRPMVRIKIFANCNEKFDLDILISQVAMNICTNKKITATNWLKQSSHFIDTESH